MAIVGSVGSLHLAEFVPPVMATLLYLLLYRRRTATLARQHRPVARWRTVLFVFGVLMVALVQVPPLDGLADSLLVAHMLQHIVIGDVASLLIVLGLTGAVLVPLLHTRASKVTRRLCHPLVALTCGRLTCTPGTCRSFTSWRLGTISCTRWSMPACCGSEPCCGWR